MGDSHSDNFVKIWNSVINSCDSYYEKKKKQTGIPHMDSLGSEMTRGFSHVKDKAVSLQSTTGVSDENSLYCIGPSYIAGHLAPPGQHSRNGSGNLQVCIIKTHSEIFPSVPRERGDTPGLKESIISCLLRSYRAVQKMNECFPGNNMREYEMNGFRRLYVAPLLCQNKINFILNLNSLVIVHVLFKRHN